MTGALTPRVEALNVLLARIAHGHSPAALSSSLSIEDMVLTDAILGAGLTIDVFTLDTGRLHGDTLDLVGRIERRYGARVLVYRPLEQGVADYESRFGRDAFYTDIALRKRCCEIRKLEPLGRALDGRRAWITGLRREQGVTRTDVPIEEFDAVRELHKFNPLADWTEAEVWDYLRAHDVPYNRLYDQGYRSIGCAPCSRPVVTGEDARAGRWWWELPETRECGLHVAPDGRLVRAKEVQT